MDNEINKDGLQAQVEELTADKKRLSLLVENLYSACKKTLEVDGYALTGDVRSLLEYTLASVRGTEDLIGREMAQQIRKGQRYKSAHSADYFEVESVEVLISQLTPGTVNVSVDGVWYDEDGNFGKADSFTGNGVATALRDGDLTLVESS